MMTPMYCKICEKSFDDYNTILKHLIEDHKIKVHNIDINSLIGVYAEFEDGLELALEETNCITFSCEGMRIEGVYSEGVLIEVYDGTLNLECLDSIGIKEITLKGGRILILLPWDFVQELPDLIDYSRVVGDEKN